jgi:hypothetical protein
MHIVSGLQSALVCLLLCLSFVLLALGYQDVIPYVPSIVELSHPTIAHVLHSAFRPATGQVHFKSMITVSASTI